MDVVTFSPSALARRLGDEMIVVNLADEQVYALSATAARCWELLADGAPADDLADRLCAEFDVDGETARRSVDGFLAQLRAAGLLAEGTA